MNEGIVVIDKPKGPTSHDIVQEVKRIFGATKAGHTGTLDPLATGVLVVCLEGATKLVSKFMEGDKEYLVTMQLGVTSDTFDTEGQVKAGSEIPADVRDRIKKALPHFTGEIMQVPPHYSAVKFEGKPLYKWAREGRLIDLPPRPIEIKEFEIESLEQNLLRARVRCSKGTYIRALAHDLGAKIGCGAIMKELRRTATGPFNINDSNMLEELEAARIAGGLDKYLIKVNKNNPLQLKRAYVKERGLWH